MKPSVYGRAKAENISANMATTRSKPLVRSEIDAAAIALARLLVDEIGDEALKELESGRAKR